MLLKLIGLALLTAIPLALYLTRNRCMDCKHYSKCKNNDYYFKHYCNGMYPASK